MRIRILCAAAMFGGSVLTSQTLTREQLSAAAQIYFRDSSELPMDVAVTATVQNAAGKTTKTVRSTVRVLFKGYNIKSHRFSFTGNSGWFNTGSLRDSFAGNFGAFAAAGMAADPLPDAQVRIEADSASVQDINCHSVGLLERWCIPKNYCGVATYHLGKAADGSATFDHFTLELGGMPVRTKVAYLGDVELKSYAIEGNFQSILLPGDPKPFYIPGQITATLVTNDGKVKLANSYSPQKPKK